MYICFYFCAERAEEDRGILLQGVKQIPSPQGGAGVLSLFGSNSFPLLSIHSKSGATSPVAAASYFGHGRAVIFAHSLDLNSEYIQLLENAVLWTARKSLQDKDCQSVRIAVLTDSIELTQTLINQNWIHSVRIYRTQLLGTDLYDFEVLIIDQNISTFSVQEVRQIQLFLASGKGLVCYADGIEGFQQTAEYPGNILFGEDGGIVWIGIELDASQDKVKFDKVTLNGTHGYWEWEEFASGRLASASRDKMFQITSTISTAFAHALHYPRAPFVKRVLGYLEANQAPIPTMSIQDRFSAVLQDTLNAHYNLTSPRKIKKSPTADIFPGMNVNLDTEPKRIVYLELDFERREDREQWLGTDLYAVPGRVVTLELLSNHDPECIQSLGVQIGSQPMTLDLFSDMNWERGRTLLSRKLLTVPCTTIVSNMGGLLYIVVPAGLKGARVCFLAWGGIVEALPFIVGTKHTETIGIATATPAQSPWLELIIPEKLILTVPRNLVAGILESLENILSALGKSWGSVGATGVERIVVDIGTAQEINVIPGQPVQISMAEAEKMLRVEPYAFGEIWTSLSISEKTSKETDLRISINE
jgi:hypothetical protein